MKKTTKLTKKAGKEDKDRRPKASDEVMKVVTELTELSKYAELLSARCMGIANGLGRHYHSSAGAVSMSSWQADRYTENLPESTHPNKLDTPLGVAVAPPGGAIPPLKGDQWTAEQLADPKFTRPVLAKLLESLGEDPKGKMAPTLRSEILQIQAGPAEKLVGECEVTGEEDVEFVKVTYEGETYQVGLKVLKAVDAKRAQWSEVFEGTFDNF